MTFDTEMHVAGEALPAYSESIDELTISGACHSSEYTVNETHTTFGSVHITAPTGNNDDANMDDDEQRSPVALSCVIDISSSMHKTMPIVKKTLHFLVANLTKRDRLSIVTFGNDARVEFPLQHMTSNNKKTVMDIIDRISTTGYTALCGGILAGLGTFVDANIKNYKTLVEQEKALYALGEDNDKQSPSHVVTGTYVFTDGAANIGLTKTPQILAAMQSVMSETRFVETTGNFMQVSTFGFGAGHNEDMLRAIADAHEGQYFNIESDEAIPDAFSTALGGLVSTVIENLVIKITPSPHCTFGKWVCDYPVEQNGGAVRVGSLQQEDTKDILFELTIGANMTNSKDPNDDSNEIDDKVCDVSYTFFDVATGKQTERHVPLSVRRIVASSAKEPSITINKDVDRSVQRTRVATALKESSLAARRGSFTCANETLVDAMRAVHASVSSAANDMETQYLCAEMERAKIMVATPQAYASTGASKKMAARHQMIAQQRCNIADSVEAESQLNSQAFQFYEKKGHKAMKSKAKSWFS